MCDSPLFRLIVSLACGGMLLPVNASAAEPSSLALPAPTTQIQDVALHAGSVLVGRVIDANGRGMSEEAVTLHHGRQNIAEVTTDTTGTYRFHDVRSGQYVLSVGSESCIFRVWTAESAPPRARRVPTIVGTPSVVRAQGGYTDSYYGQAGRGSRDGLAMTIVGVAAITSAVLAGIGLAEINDLEKEIAQLKSP